MRDQSGFTLIELIAAIVLLGFIGIFSSIFISTGVRGALNSRQAEENAQKGQIALERIALELRDINGGTGSAGGPRVVASPPSITYTSAAAALAGTRTLAYSANAITLTPASGGTAYTLVDGVTSCTMTFDATYNTLTVSFTLANAGGTFSITVKPRSTVVPTST